MYRFLNGVLPKPLAGLALTAWYCALILTILYLSGYEQAPFVYAEF